MRSMKFLPIHYSLVSTKFLFNTLSAALLLSKRGSTSSTAVTASPDFIDLELPSPPPPPPPASWAPGRKTAAAAANRRPGLRLRPNWISTGHIPTGNGADGGGCRPSPSGEGEA
jgi:hypothetical protein